ncbi:72_t:CDS:2, partial [Racocetra persica]
NNKGMMGMRNAVDKLGYNRVKEKEIEVKNDSIDDGKNIQLYNRLAEELVENYENIEISFVEIVE